MEEYSSTCTKIDKPEHQRWKDPMLLSPVIKCVLGFLNIRDIKNCRLVSREWGSAGKIALASRALVHFRKDKYLPLDFYWCFRDSINLFTSFKISGYGGTWTKSELTEFFTAQGGRMKELALESVVFFETELDISSWICKSPMISKDTKGMTKLTIEGCGKLSIPLHFLTNIKELSLSECRLNIEEGIQICPVRLKLTNTGLYQDKIKLHSILLNDIVNFSKAKEISIDFTSKGTAVKINLRGNIFLEKLCLLNVEVLNWETSKWDVNYLKIESIPFLTKTTMIFKDLYFCDSNIDLSVLPQSIEKLALDFVRSPERLIISCSQMFSLEKLKYLNVSVMTDYSVLSYFMNCPQLTHLKLNAWSGIRKEIKSMWMPKSIKTLVIEGRPFNWIDDNCLNLEKLVFRGDVHREAKTMCNSKIQAQDIIMDIDTGYDIKEHHKELVQFLGCRKRFSFGKRLYIGKIRWANNEPEDSILKEQVDIIGSPFYVFENGKQGRAISEETFIELADIPKHIRNIITL